MKSPVLSMIAAALLGAGLASGAAVLAARGADNQVASRFAGEIAVA